MLKSIIAFILFFPILLFSATPAFAWGPGIHLAIGNFILENTGLLAPAIALLLKNHPASFLYGCLSADILIGKGKKITPKHCHSWEAGLNLLRNAQSDCLKAYGHGYLSHLAADIVAHNYFVPNLLQKLPGKGKFSHVYIEMQADRKVGWQFKQANKIIWHPNPEADSSLLSVLQKPKLTFNLKKKLYQSSISLTSSRSWKSSLFLLDQAMPFEKDWWYLQEMLSLSLSVVLDTLNHYEEAAALLYDPMGIRNLDFIKKRKKLERAKVIDPSEPYFFLPDSSITSLPLFYN